MYMIKHAAAAPDAAAQPDITTNAQQGTAPPPPPPPPQSSHTDEEGVIGRLQPSVQEKASHLLSYLKTQYNLNWNEKGEVCFKNSSPITGTHICDILQYVTSSNPDDLPPTGLEDVLQTIAHIPSALITNPNLSGGSAIPPGIPTKQRALVQTLWKDQWRPI